MKWVDLIVPQPSNYHVELADRVSMKANKKNKDHRYDNLRMMVGRLKREDPELGRLLEIKIRKQASQKSGNAEILRRLRIQNIKLLEQVATFKQQLKQVKTDNNKIMNLNKGLSDALGSCSRCWGEDPECKTCWGNGSPGWRTINKRMFNLYVLPALGNPNATAK